MSKDTFSEIDTSSFLQLDLSQAYDMATSIQAEIGENHNRAMAAANEAYEDRQRTQRAIEQTATNTAESNGYLEKIIQNLMDLTDRQKEQLITQKNQLDILYNIFASDEDEVQVEKEIMRLIQEQIDESHPLWDYVKDKGGDLAVAVVPIICNAVRTFLVSRGLHL